MKSKFTLVEILGVTALITLLAVIGFAGYGYAMNAVRESATRSLIHSLETALEGAKGKSSYIPSSDNFITIKVKLRSDNDDVSDIEFDSEKLMADTASESQKKFAKEFLKIIDLENLKKYLNKSDGTINDSWGNPIRYKYLGTFNQEGIDLISAGIDGGFGVDKSADPVDDKTKYFYPAVDPAVDPAGDTAGEAKCDDVMNFK